MRISISINLDLENISQSEWEKMTTENDWTPYLTEVIVANKDKWQIEADDIQED